MKWEKVKLGDVFKTASGGTPSRKITNYYNGDISWVKSGDLNYNTILDTEEKISLEAIENSSAKIFPKGTLLIAMYGATIGKLAILGIDATTNQAICGIFDNGNDYIKYVYYFLLFKKTDLVSIGIGGAQPNISQDIIKNLQIPLPPLPTQRAIADRLDRADALRQKDRQLLQAYDDLAQSVFVEMFGDPVRNEKGWEVVKLEKCYSSQKEGTKCGPFGSALKKEEYQEGGVPVWVMDNIVGHDFDPKNCLFISIKKYDDLNAYSVQNGDIIISRAGTVGKMCVIESSFDHSIISTNLIKLSLDRNKMLPLYFVRLMAYFGSKIGRLRKGNDGAFTHMNTGILNNLEVPRPPLPLQTRFAAILANIERQKDLVRRQQVQSEALFGRLLQEAFGE